MKKTLPQPAPKLTPAEAGAEGCVTCGTALVGPYCHQCGEKRLHRHDYALAHFLEHTIDAVTHFDLRVLRDLWWQLRRPGFLAAEWLRGRRVPHAPPVQLFLVTNVLFYLLAGTTGFSPFQTELRYHFGRANGYGGLARRLVHEHLQTSGTSLAQFTGHFNELAHVYSKSLVFLFIPLLLLPLWLLFRRQRRYFVEWLTVSTYLFAGLLLLFALMAALSLSARVLPALLGFFNNDDLVTTTMFGLTIGYAALFLRRAFPGQRWLPVLGKAVLFTLSFLVALIGPYRFVLFLVCYLAAR